MSKYKSVFVEQLAHNWILDILGNDIISGLERLGYKCRKGKYDEYLDEDVSFHMWWGDAVPHKKAKINAVFITHTDDKFKEDKLVRMRDDFDLFFCMSPEDRQFLIELGYDETKVFGFNLPVRNTYVRPISIGIFSKCYPDKRKNEEWLFDFCKSNPKSKLVDFVFIGEGWGDFVTRLSKMGCSFQWHNVSRNMPYEYMYQQLKLSNLDYYIYMGMDGGAMGSYDAYAMGASLCITDDGFHKGMPYIDYPFSTKEGFCSQLSNIVNRQSEKLLFYENNSVENYVNNVVYVLENEKFPEGVLPVMYHYSVKEKRRSHYFNRNLLLKIMQFIRYHF